LKTDDDTFINVPLVRKKLRCKEAAQSWWWSSFREFWPVQNYGKWREDSYVSTTYPPFPCGAGYVMTADLVQYLAVNAAKLNCFQGEDVSTGIWLAPLKPFLDSSCWECSKCVPNACNVPQLSIEQMYKFWHNYLQYNNISCV
jgi:hypothetical protein